ncbi:MAG: hypothetical protein ABI679_11765 [Gemmatimonadota bacterium]
MDHLIPVFGMISGMVVTGIVIFGFIRLMHSPVGVALGRRLQGRAGELDDEVRGDVAWLREQVEEVQRQLSETQERLDFTERLLSQSKQVGQLSGER